MGVQAAGMPWQAAGGRGAQQAETVAFKVMLRRGGREDKTRSLQVLCRAERIWNCCLDC